jgi:hypothetical protein
MAAKARLHRFIHARYQPYLVCAWDECMWGRKGPRACETRNIEMQHVHACLSISDMAYVYVHIHI